MCVCVLHLCACKTEKRWKRERGRERDRDRDREREEGEITDQVEWRCQSAEGGSRGPRRCWVAPHGGGCSSCCCAVLWVTPPSQRKVNLQTDVPNRQPHSALCAGSRSVAPKTCIRSRPGGPETKARSGLKSPSISEHLHLQISFGSSVSVSKIINTKEVFFCFEFELFGAQPCWLALYQ